jgi:hypothetical protein
VRDGISASRIAYPHGISTGPVGPAMTIASPHGDMWVTRLSESGDTYCHQFENVSLQAGWQPLLPGHRVEDGRDVAGLVCDGLV